MECEVAEVCWTAPAIHLTGLSDIVVIFRVSEHFAAVAVLEQWSR
jgi:hypothetical protein